MTYRVCRTYEYGFFMLILTIMLTLSGCGNWKGKDSGNENALGNNTAVNDGVETADAENPIQYTKRFQELTMPINTYYFQIVGQRLYAASLDYNTGIFKRYYMEELDGSASYVELMSSGSMYQEGSEDCIGFFVDEEEYLYFILCKKDDLEEQQYYLCKCTSEGQELFRTDVTEQLGFAYDNWNSYQSAAVDRNGRIYIATRNYIFLYDENGEYHGLLEDTHVCSIARGKDGSVYYTKSKSMAIAVGATLELVKVDFEGKKAAAIYSDFPTGYNYNSLWPGIGYDFLIIDEKYLYGYKLETQTTEQILTWSDAYMRGQNLIYVGEQENGKILLIEWQNPLQLVSLTMQDEMNPLPEKEILTIGMTRYDADMESFENLQKLVNQFNRTQEQYEVVFKTYGESIDYYGGTAAESRDGMNALSLELAAGKGPDLIIKNTYFPFYAKRGFLEDLRGYLENSEVLSEEDYMEIALEMHTFDSVLTAVPAFFCAFTYGGYTDQIGDKRGRTMEEFLELAEKYQDMPLLSISDPISGVRDFAESLYSYIDWENRTCSFDSEEFKAFLEYCKDGPKLEVDYEIIWELGKDYLLKEYFLGGVSGFDKLLREKKDITLIGFPVKEGDGMLWRDRSFSFAMGISSRSKHKEGAWDFLEYLHTTESGYFSMYDGWSAKISKLEKELSDFAGSELFVDIGEYYTVTEEDVEYIRELIQNASTIDSTNLYSNIVMQIIEEEAESYFAGDKSVEEVTEIIQKRIQLYLDENF